MKLIIELSESNAGHVTATVSRASGEMRWTAGRYGGMSRAGASSRVRDIVAGLLTDWTSKRKSRQLAPVAMAKRKKA